MKKQTLLLLTLLTIFSLKSSGQVTLEHAHRTGHCEFWLTDIGNNDYKYVIMDSTGFSLYNLDHSPYLVGFVPPLPIWQPPIYYEVMYITKTLFDCDSTNLEYVIANNGFNGFYVYRTDGTLLFGRDSVTGPYCYGCNDGSVTIKPITNTNDGAKLILFKGDGSVNDSSWVYSLCGSLPLIVDENSITADYVKVFPNPTNGIINFEITPPSNMEKFKLTIYNSSFQVVDEKIVTDRKYQLDLKTRSLSSGTYLFDLRTERKIFQTGKFVIAK